MRDPQGSHSPEAGAHLTGIKTLVFISIASSSDPTMWDYNVRPTKPSPPKRAHVIRAPDTTTRPIKSACVLSAEHNPPEFPLFFYLIPNPGRERPPTIHRTQKLSETPDSLYVKQRRSHPEPAEWPGAPCIHRAQSDPMWAVKPQPPQPHHMRRSATGA
jgi:hypothetical protein